MARGRHPEAQKANSVILRELDGFLRLGNPVPLAWVVEHGDRFEEIWSSNSAPQIMLRIAARVVRREDLILAAAAVARTGLKYVPMEEKRPKAAIEAAEAWARGARITAEAMDGYAARAFMVDPEKIGTASTGHAANAAAYVAQACYAVEHVGTDVYSVGNESWDAGCAGLAHRSSAAATSIGVKLAEKVSKRLRGKVTLAGVIGAAREARR